MPHVNAPSVDLPTSGDRSFRLDMAALPLRASDIEAAATQAESVGFDGWHTGETGGDAFISAAVAGRATQRIRVGTAVAIAFARNPMTVAYGANDAQGHAGGRFLLGLGTQVRAHVTRRFAMPWSQPVERMREFVAALRAIWTSWFEETPLDFRGDFYEHTLMTPMFVGDRHDHGPPPIALAAVGPRMTQLAGEVADAVLVHAFSTDRFLREHMLSDLRRGRARRDGAAHPVSVMANAFVIVDDGSTQAQDHMRAVRKQLAFYGSTPAYRRVLDLHGWGDAQTTLQGLARQGRWDDMAEVIDDEMLRTFAIVSGTAQQAGEALVRRFGGVADRVLIYPTWQPGSDDVRAIRRGTERALEN